MHAAGQNRGPTLSAVLRSGQFDNPGCAYRQQKCSFHIFVKWAYIVAYSGRESQGIETEKGNAT